MPDDIRPLTRRDKLGIAGCIAVVLATAGTVGYFIRDCRGYDAVAAKVEEGKDTKEGTVKRTHPDFKRLVTEDSIVYNAVRSQPVEGGYGNTIGQDLSCYVAFVKDLGKTENKVKIDAAFAKPNQEERDAALLDLEKTGLLTQVYFDRSEIGSAGLQLIGDRLANVDSEGRYVRLNADVFRQLTMKIRGSDVDNDGYQEVVVGHPDGVIFLPKGYEWKDRTTDITKPRYQVINSSAEMHLAPEDPASAVRADAMGAVLKEARTARRVSAKELEVFRTELYKTKTAEMNADATEVRTGLKTSLDGDAKIILDETDRVLFESGAATLGVSLEKFLEMLNDKENTFAPAKK